MHRRSTTGHRNDVSPARERSNVKYMAELLENKTPGGDAYQLAAKELSPKTLHKSEATRRRPCPGSLFPLRRPRSGQSTATDLHNNGVSLRVTAFPDTE